MGHLQQLNEAQMTDVLETAAEKRVPVTFMVWDGDQWISLRSRFLAKRNGDIIFEPPSSWDAGQAPAVQVDQAVGISFKLKHHKHVFDTTVRGTVEMPDDDGAPISALSLVGPVKVERLQRRAYKRAQVPPNRIVRVSFWLGGQGDEPMGSSPQRPVHVGKVVDLSAGGFQAEMPSNAALGIDEGDTVGLRLVFGAASETIRADARFRHAQYNGGGDIALMGFQFLGLDRSEDGKGALKLISEKVKEFHRLAK